MKLSCSVSRDTGITLDGGAAVPWPSMAGAFSVHGDRCRDKLMARNFIWDPNHWRFRAEEARMVADQMTHEAARTIMRRIALDYDRLAKLAEEQLADQERGATGDNAHSVRALPCQNASLHWVFGPPCFFGQPPKCEVAHISLH